MVIQYAPRAQKDLTDIYEYGKETFGIRTSKRFIEKIRKNIKVLKHSPYIGLIEESLSAEKQEYRSLLVSPYKIIYSVMENTVRIHFLWHTSRNPQGLTKQTLP